MTMLTTLAGLALRALAVTGSTEDAPRARPTVCEQGGRPPSAAGPARGVTGGGVPLLLAIVVLAVLPAPSRAQEVVEYYATDALGSVRVVFTPAGNVVGRIDFEPFGGEVGSSAGAPPERFTGNQREPEAGLDYFHARQYQPRTGRFTGVDPVYAGLFDLAIPLQRVVSYPFAAVDTYTAATQGLCR